MTPAAFLTKYPSLLTKHGSQRAVALATGIPRTTMQDWLRNEKSILFSQQAPKPPIKVAAPKRGTKRFIFTSAQDNTAVHLPFLENLEAYAEHLGATLVVAGFTYNKRLYSNHETEGQVFAEEVVPYLSNRRMDIGPRLTFAGEMNTLPTAESPLSGFEAYTKERSGIFPHAKIQLSSIPTQKGLPAKQIMTTGAVTLPNYVQKKAGLKAEFHHVLGAVIVEIDSDGDHFCRHLIADEDDGSFQDLTAIVRGGKVTDGHRVEAIVWGDIHFEAMDQIVAQATVGFHEHTPDCMLDWLRPRIQVLHDTIDFRSRNHHNIKDAHFRLRMFHEGSESVENSLDGAAYYLTRARRPWCQGVVVKSNHDLALLRWLKEADWKNDPINTEFYLKAQLACVVAIREGDNDFDVFEWALKQSCPSLDVFRFLKEDESFLVANDIECGEHGHNGANGSRSTPTQFARMGRKSVTAHAHSPSILGGAYRVGTSSKLDLGYNKGLSSWSHTHCVVYPSGKRTLITMAGAKWCAE